MAKCLRQAETLKKAPAWRLAEAFGDWFIAGWLAPAVSPVKSTSLVTKLDYLKKL